ncbi:MAG TPA: hypothetical protein VIV54_10760 [Burkholderiales bacterium]|jgi:hypothetical protein
MKEQFDAARESAAKGARSAYNTASEYPGTIAAVVVGLAITGVLIWAARRAGGWQNLQSQAADVAREGIDYAKEGYEKARDKYRDRFTRSSSPASMAE